MTFKIVKTYDGPCTYCKAKLGARHKRGCKFIAERTVGISGTHALRQIGVTVVGKKQRVFVEFPK